MDSISSSFQVSRYLPNKISYPTQAGRHRQDQSMLPKSDMASRCVSLRWQSLRIHRFCSKARRSARLQCFQMISSRLLGCKEIVLRYVHVPRFKAGCAVGCLALSPTRVTAWPRFQSPYTPNNKCSLLWAISRAFEIVTYMKFHEAKELVCAYSWAHQIFEQKNAESP